MADPTFQQLRVFLVVAEERHVGRAAARLHMAQPPVSRHIKALEAVLGVALFERDSRGVTLTRAGTMIRPEVQNLLRGWDGTAARARDLAKGRRRPVVLGAVESMVVDALPTAIATLRARHQDLEWELSEGHTDDLLDGFTAGRFDAVLVRGPVPTGNHETVSVCQDELVVALPEGHRLNTPEVTLADLADEDFIVYSRRTTRGLLNTMIAACGQAGFVPRIRSEALGTELLLGLVAAGDGIAMISRVVARVPHPGVRFAGLRGRPALSPILLIWQRATSGELMTELATLLRDAAVKAPPERT